MTGGMMHGMKSRMASGANLPRRSGPFRSAGSGVGKGSTLSTRAQDFHRAFQQFLKFAAFDSWSCINEILVLRCHDRYLFVYLKTAMI
jgi:hypothetical protein